MIEDVLISLRDVGEVSLIDEDGKAKPRANRVAWSDRIVLPQQRSFFSYLSKADVDAPAYQIPPHPVEPARPTGVSG
jgi:hypothetical protein